MKRYLKALRTYLAWAFLWPVFLFFPYFVFAFLNWIGEYEDS